MLVVSLAAGLVPFDPAAWSRCGGVADATFKRPVRFGDTIHVEGRIAELGAGADDAGLVTFAWNVVNQDDRIVCRARVDVLWRRRRTPVETSSTIVRRRATFVPIPL